MAEKESEACYLCMSEKWANKHLKRLLSGCRWAWWEPRGHLPGTVICFMWPDRLVAASLSKTKFRSYWEFMTIYYMSERLSTRGFLSDKRKSISPKVVLQKYVSLRAAVFECLWPGINPFRTKTTSNKSFRQQPSLRVFFPLTLLHLELQAVSPPFSSPLLGES